MKVGSYILGGHLGSGVFSDVFKAYDENDPSKKPYAIKRFKDIPYNVLDF